LELPQARKLIRETYWRLQGIHYTYNMDADPSPDNQHPVKRIIYNGAFGVDSVKAAVLNRSPAAWLLDRAYRYDKFGIRELTGWSIDQFLDLSPEAIEDWFEIAAEVMSMKARDRQIAEEKAKAAAKRANGAGG